MFVASTDPSTLTTTTIAASTTEEETTVASDAEVTTLPTETYNYEDTVEDSRLSSTLGNKKIFDAQSRGGMGYFC